MGRQGGKPQKTRWPRLPPRNGSQTACELEVSQRRTGRIGFLATQERRGMVWHARSSKLSKRSTMAPPLPPRFSAAALDSGSSSRPQNSLRLSCSVPDRPPNGHQPPRVPGPAYRFDAPAFVSKLCKRRPLRASGLDPRHQLKAHREDFAVQQPRALRAGELLNHR